MLPTIRLTDIVGKWVTLLGASAELAAFCQTNFAKEASIFVNLNEKNKPKVDVAPMIALYPGSKTEGLDSSQYSYTIGLSWVIKDAHGLVKTGNAYEMPDVGVLDDMGQLIYTILATASDNYPVSDLQYAIEPTEFYPLLVGHMEITINVPRILGAGMTF